MKTLIKKLTEKLAPSFAKAYRQWRDDKIHKRKNFKKTGLGFEFIGDADIDTSREKSGEISVMKRAILGADAFIDVGANAGFFSMISGQVRVETISIEPNTLNFDLLLRNIQKNKFEIEAYMLALSDRVGVASLFGGGQGASLMPNWGGMAQTYSTLVPTNTLDRMLLRRYTGKRLAIKIDVEGHEYSVLTGSFGLLSMEPAPVWIIEHGLQENFDGGLNPNFRKVFEVFWEKGYVACTADNEEKHVNEADVDRWIANKTKDFGGINYIFRKN